MMRVDEMAAPAPTRRWFSWGRLKQMIKKETLQLVRDPKSRPIIFVSPVVQMILLGYAATTDVKDISTMVVDHDNTAESRALVEAFKTTDYFIITKHSERDADVVSALAKGDVQMGLTIPPGLRPTCAVVEARRSRRCSTGRTRARRPSRSRTPVRSPGSSV